MEIAGIEESELIDTEMGFDMGLIKVPVTELSAFGTACGTKNNKAFSKEVIDFLQSGGIEFIIGIGENKEPVISSTAVHISGEEAENFSEMINKNEGSFTSEDSKVGGWSVFGSE